MERESFDRRLQTRLASALEGREEILEAYLFGSHARGQAQPHSDIATHLGSALGLDPLTCGSAIDCLVEANVLPSNFGARFRRIAGIRDVLVHGYLDVDLDLVAEILAGQLDDFEEFARHVERWFTESPGA